MAIKKVLIYPDPRLKKVCEPVTDFGPELKQLVKDLKDTLNSYGDRALGLAAPQIGVLKRVFVARSTIGIVVYINPEVTIPEDGTFEMKTEGCLSFPGVFERVKRATQVWVKHHDENGIRIGNTYPGSFGACASAQLAHVIQHETEHLDGHLLSDGMTRARRGQVMGEMRKIKNVVQ